MKRCLSIALIALMVLSLCVSGAALAEGKTKLNVSFWGSETEMNTKVALMDMVKEKFDVDIDYWYVVGGDYPAKLTTVLASGDVPDLMEMANDVFFPFKDTGYVENLKPYMEKDNLLSGTWKDASVGQYTYGDVIYAAPTVTKTFVVIYNKALFDAAGLEYPVSGWTEEDLLDKARKLSSGEGVNQIFGFDWGWALDETMRGLYANPVYDANTMSMNIEGNAAFRHTMELLKTMYDENMMIYGSSTDASFTNGTVAMALAWAASVVDGSFVDQIGDSFDWDIVTLPVSEEYGPWNCTARTDGWMMSSVTDKKDLVWDVIKYLTTEPECSVRHSFNNGIPTLLSVIDAGSFINESVLSKNISAVTDQITNSVTFQTAGVWGEINSEIQYNLELYLYGDQDIDEALDAMNSFGNKKLAK